ncbi:MAG: 2,3-diphosphoglycerate-dependent phosphoglycerate mutase [Ferrovum sp.]|jgi:2,3-bisphosphoglycerate-dependent phosphoglycerate mutase|nr:2,3-diphosphoglycerate-dependent phosphoglycerate mutase [Ferrovum sp.]
MKKIVLLRHGQSIWNQENRFTGWTDVPLSPLGIREAVEAGKMLKSAELSIDLAYTSVLQRAIKTLWLTLEQMDRLWISTVKDWRLNERHYGDLQGLNKIETAAKFGEEQVLLWRRSYSVIPPLLSETDPRWEASDPRYRSIPKGLCPRGESLKNTVDRVIPYWNGEIVPQVLAGRQVMLVAHGNSLRALMKHLGRMTEDEIMKINLPTGIPLVYELDDNLMEKSRYFLGDPEEVARMTQAVANQGRKEL